MFGHFRCNYETFGAGVLRDVELSDDDVSFRIAPAILVEVLGGAEDASAPRTLAVCERERARIEAACRKARARAPKDTTITLTRGDFAATDSERLVLVFPDSKTAQQFGGWVFSEGYPARVISQNIVSLYVLVQDRKRIVQEAGDRNGQVGR
jgi:hypothetical protein